MGTSLRRPPLAEVLVSFRRGSELRSCDIEQAILCEFIVEGHFGRHLRKMRDLYTERLEALFHYGDRYLNGLLKLSDAKAGLYISAFLQNGMASGEAEARAAASGIETRALDRFTLKHRDPKGLLLGFASFDERSIRAGTIQLAAALSARKRLGASGM